MYRPFRTYTRCLKITEKVSFNIASEASYVYILSGQKFIKNAKNAPCGEFFLKTWSLLSNSVMLPDKNWRKMPKLENSNETFWVIFKQCGWSGFQIKEVSIHPLMGFFRPGKGPNVVYHYLLQCLKMSHFFCLNCFGQTWCVVHSWKFEKSTLATVFENPSKRSHFVTFIFTLKLLQIFEPIIDTNCINCFIEILLRLLGKVCIRGNHATFTSLLLRLSDFALLEEKSGQTWGHQIAQFVKSGKGKNDSGHFENVQKTQRLKNRHS